MNSEEFVRNCWAIAEEKKAKYGVIMDLRGFTIIADFFLVMTVNNNRHAQAVVNDIVDETKGIKRKAVSRDGDGRSGWVVLDLGDVIVHVFTASVREKYNLEDLWKQCPLILDERGVEND